MSDPFLLSTSEVETTETMRADGAIPQDWRYIEIPWQQAEIFDKIVEIGGADLQILACDQSDEKKRGQVVFGPEASKRINERAFEIHVLFKTAAYEIELDAMESEKAA